ncbi:MAG: NAD-binding protein, partial [Calditrichaeota bacterium]|nr:NAD-binding protein [Calditrichota bacterium]
GAITMLFGIGVLGMFTASIASVFVEKKLRINRGMSSFEFNNHIVICEWNYRAREILSSLRADPRTREKTVLLIADLPEKPVEDENLYFIQGDITEENMKRANLKGADTAVVLGDDSLDPNARDAQVVLAALAIENLNSEVYTIVELVNERNVRHCQRARVDEIIVGSEFSSKLIARAAMDHGISVVLTELVSSEQGNDLHKRALPEAFDGKTFFEVFVDMKKQHNRTVVAVQRGGDRRVVSNPPGDMVLKKGDFLIQIAPKEDSVSEKRVAKSE